MAIFDDGYCISYSVLMSLLYGNDKVPHVCRKNYWCRISKIFVLHLKILVLHLKKNLGALSQKYWCWISKILVLHLKNISAVSQKYWRCVSKILVLHLKQFVLYLE